MVKLRLRRRGRKQAPIYDIVAMDSRKTRDGAYLELIGQYNPRVFPSQVTLKTDRAIYWLRAGAQPTGVMESILSHEGVLLQMYLERKGKSADEIQAELATHKETVAKRLERLGEKRRTKLSKRKKSAIEAEKKAVDDAKAAEAAAKLEAAAQAAAAKAAAETAAAEEKAAAAEAKAAEAKAAQAEAAAAQTVTDTEPTPPPAEVRPEGPVEVPPEPPVKIPDEAPLRQPEEVPTHSPANAPDEAPLQTPVEVPMGTPREM
jgi:small subunit ribosomal protein S16